jgi:hypothetical protein
MYKRSGYQWDTYNYVQIIDYALPKEKYPIYNKDYKDHQFWFFGGSAMCGGYSSPGGNPASIALEFTRLLNKHRRKMSVYNFGTPGHVSDQNRRWFTELVHKNPLPDVVCFYDGFNEIMNGPYGDNSSYMRTILNGKVDKRSFPDLFKINRVKILYLLTTLFNIGPVPKHANGYQNYFVFSEATNLSQEEEIINIYISNLILTESICEKLGIKCYFIWQPYIGNKKHLTDKEKRQLEDRNYGALRYSPNSEETYKRIYEKIKIHPLLRHKENFLYFGNIFLDNKDEIFIDEVHLDEKYNGNNIIAEKLYSIIFKEDLER